MITQRLYAWRRFCSLHEILQRAQDLEVVQYELVEVKRTKLYDFHPSAMKRLESIPRRSY